MSGPITWQNIQGRPTVDVGRTMDSASRLLLGAIGNAQKGVQDYDMGQREITKQDFLNTLMSAKTPEEVAALKASGELDAKLATLDPSVQAQVRGADDAYIGSLQKQGLTTNAYNESQLVSKYKPVADKVANLYAQGKTKEAEALIAANPEMPNQGQLTMDGQKLISALALQNAQTRNANASAAYHLAQANAAGKADSKALTAQADAIIKAGPYSGGHLGTLEGKKNLRDALTKMDLVPAQIDAIMAKAGEYASGKPEFDEAGNPVRDASNKQIRTPIPVNYFIEAALQKPFDWKRGFGILSGAFGVSGRGDDAIGEVFRRMDMPENRADLDASLKAMGTKMGGQPNKVNLPKPTTTSATNAPIPAALNPKDEKKN